MKVSIYCVLTEIYSVSIVSEYMLNLHNIVYVLLTTPFTLNVVAIMLQCRQLSHITHQNACLACMDIRIKETLNIKTTIRHSAVKAIGNVCKYMMATYIVNNMIG